MSRLTRFTAKLFGNTASAAQIATFGSLANGTPATTSGPLASVSTIQSLAQWASGWFAAVIGANSPAIEDMNGAFFVFAYQLAYLMQVGIAEWDTDTTYYIGDLAQDGAGNIYVSLTDDNSGNALTDTTNWSPQNRVVDESSQTVGGTTGIVPAVSGDEVLTIAGATGWVAQTPSATNQWLSICWSPALGLFAAVSNNGTNRVMTSPDGVAWTARSAASALLWYSVCWSPDLSLFCAVAGGSTSGIMTSPDGITWTTRTAPSTDSLYQVCWSHEKSIFVAMAGGSVSYTSVTSPDGVTWTGHTSAAAGTSIVWASGLGLFIATQSGISPAAPVQISPDGVNWTSISIAGGTWLAAQNSLAYSPQLGMVVLSTFLGSGTYRIFYSRDGRNWVAGNGFGLYEYSITWSPEIGMFMAVAGTDVGAQEFCAFSPDGINWTQELILAATHTWACVAYSPSLYKFVAVAYDGTVASFVPNIITASPTITAGTVVGKKLTLYGEGFPVQLSQGNNLFMPNTLFLFGGKTASVLWNQSDNWVQV